MSTTWHFISSSRTIGILVTDHNVHDTLSNCFSVLYFELRIGALGRNTGKDFTKWTSQENILGKKIKLR